MFLQNKYTTWYYAIIHRGQDRILTGYKENHHIIPKSLNGSDDKSNLVSLTAREHLICHLLLTRMTIGSNKHKMLHAAWALTTYRDNSRDTIKITSRLYESLKIARSLMITATQSGENNPFYNKKHSNATRIKMSQSASKPKSLAWKESASTNRKGDGGSFFGKTHSDSQKEKWKTDPRRIHMGAENGFYGKTHTDEQRQKKREEKLAASKKICYYCNKSVDAMNYGRWHGDRCKSKK